VEENLEKRKREKESERVSSFESFFGKKTDFERKKITLLLTVPHVPA